VHAQFQRCGAASKVWEGEPGRWSKSLFWLSVGPSPRGLAHFMAAALPKVPMHALKLGDRISPTGVAPGPRTGFIRHAHSFSHMAPPVQFGSFGTKVFVVKSFLSLGRWSSQGRFSQVKTRAPKGSPWAFRLLVLLYISLDQRFRVN
jgi:hypothetical protein